MIENEKQADAVKVVTALARFFRISLSRGKSIITVRDELEHVRNRYDSRTGSVARQFDRICDVLTELGYLSGQDQHDVILTEHGQLLRRLYSEQDVVLAQAIQAGVFDLLRRRGWLRYCRRWYMRRGGVAGESHGITPVRCMAQLPLPRVS